MAFSNRLLVAASALALGALPTAALAQDSYGAPATPAEPASTATGAAQPATTSAPDASAAPVTATEPTAGAPADAAAASDAAGTTATDAATTDGSAAAAAPTPATTAPAQTTAQVDAGDVVKDKSGAVVGRIESVEGAEAVLATAASKVRVPLSSFAAQGPDLLFGMTAAEVDAAAKAQAPAAPSE